MTTPPIRAAHGNPAPLPEPRNIFFPVRTFLNLLLNVMSLPWMARTLCDYFVAAVIYRIIMSSVHDHSQSPCQAVINLSSDTIPSLLLLPFPHRAPSTVALSLLGVYWGDWTPWIHQEKPATRQLVIIHLLSQWHQWKNNYFKWVIDYNSRKVPRTSVLINHLATNS